MSETPIPPKAAEAKPALDPAVSAELAHAEKALSADAPGHSKAGHDKSAKSAGSKKSGKKKKGSAEPGIPLGVRVKGMMKSCATQVVEIIQGLTSPDRPTRRMSLFFFASMTCLVLVAGATISHFGRARLERELSAAALHEGAAEHIKNFLNKQVDETRHRMSMMDIGSFTVELKPPAGRKSTAANANMAELTLVLECDTAETHAFIEKNLVQIRNEITDVFVGQDRDELLTSEGKRKLKQELLERINGWLPHGKVQNIFFSKLVVA